MSSKIDKIYGNRVRVRACGLCWQENSLLLINHKGLTPGNFWSPPGGGIEFGETAHETVVREIWEETGLEVTAGSFLFACEYIKNPLHAVELFFEVNVSGGELGVGYDPEMGAEKQLLHEVCFMPYRAIRNLALHERHKMLSLFETPELLKNAVGYWKI